MSTGRYASIDVGTNSAKMTIAEISAISTTWIRDESVVARLGEGMQGTRKFLQEVPMRRNIDALKGFAEIAQRSGVSSIAAVGTAALRDAENSDEFLRRAYDTTGIRIEVISGEEEARLSYLAVRLDPHWSNYQELIVIDVGGGSTEVIFGQGAHIVSRMSVNIGAVKLTESILRSDPPTITQLSNANIETGQQFERVPLGYDPRDAVVVGVGGTISNLSAMEFGMFVLPEKLHGFELTQDAIEDRMEQLATLTIEERKRVGGLDPKRADIILGGAILLSQALARLNTTKIAVSTRGLRWGVLYDRFLPKE